MNPSPGLIRQFRKEPDLPAYQIRNFQWLEVQRPPAEMFGVLVARVRTDGHAVCETT